MWPPEQTVFRHFYKSERHHRIICNGEHGFQPHDINHTDTTSLLLTTPALSIEHGRLIGQGSILGLAKGWWKRYFAKLKISLQNYPEQLFLNIMCDFHSIYQSVLQFPTTVQYPMMDFLTKLPHFFHLRCQPTFMFRCVTNSIRYCFSIIPHLFPTFYDG
jgi:hypothetical protein